MRLRHRLVRLLDPRICCPEETRTFRPCGDGSLELDESVMNAIETRQMQQAEFVTAVPPGDEVGASHPCEATCEHADDLGEATIQFHL